jgi:hypothetical protein
MPRISQFFVRTALIYLALGSTIGGAMLAAKGIALPTWIWAWRPGHIQMLLVGWLVQLACGVAIWVLPRFDAAGDRGNAGWAWIGYGALNGGVALASLHAPLAGLAGNAGVRWMPPTAGVLYVIAGSMLALTLWRRVLPFRTLPRPAKHKGTR